MSWRSWILTSNDFAKDLNNLNADLTPTHPLQLMKKKKKLHSHV